ncbi:hatching enzyme 1.2-like isoform X2 [Bacillus rossius redtenbacheri]|uniref:hatching enzyme 1.2-like isoform X2 n=1 Tax=Bacillus rossius redtenbacheri TaxID=93214 RepID=UPI002FDEAB54
MCRLVLMLALWRAHCGARTLPDVPSAVYPPVPDQVRLSLDDIRFLQENEEDPEVRPGLFQGDMALTSELYNYWRVGLRWDVMPERMWKNGTVPYVISPLYEPEEYATIYKAIVMLNFMTCLRFVPWDGKAKDFLLIWPIKFPKGFGGPQLLSLQPPDRSGPNCLGGEGRAIHELLHALGLFHEQSRADRDQFVEVHYDNIIPEFKVNFEKESLENTTYSFEYDYDSVLHYGSYSFSKEKGLPTITPKKKEVKLGQREGMSQTDCLKINDLYGCLDRSPAHQRKYYTLCRYMGL